MSSPRAFRLADGRSLAFDEFGDPHGVPVVNCHGGLTSRLDAQRCHQTAADAGVRVISPDRPGIGRSDAAPGRTLLDWPRDVEQLADGLGIARFGVLGWSAGGMYAAACAFALSDRVVGLALVASGIPGDWPGMTEEINRMDRELLRLSHRARPIASTVFRLMHLSAAHSPAVFRRLSLRTLDPPSRAVVTQGTSEEYAEPIAEGLRRTGGVIEDYRILGSAWGFDPGAITTRVTIWQGDADALVPPAWAERLGQRITSAEVHPCPDEGHFLSVERYREIYATLAAQATPRSG
jgi:pimeloyl-ACP methyl ester carboxylesterase